MTCMIILIIFEFPEHNLEKSSACYYAHDGAVRGTVEDSGRESQVK